MQLNVSEKAKVGPRYATKIRSECFFVMRVLTPQTIPLIRSLGKKGRRSSRLMPDSVVCG